MVHPMFSTDAEDPDCKNPRIYLSNGQSLIPLAAQSSKYDPNLEQLPKDAEAPLKISELPVKTCHKHKTSQVEA